MRKMFLVCAIGVMFYDSSVLAADSPTADDLVVTLARREQDINSLTGRFTVQAEYLSGTGFTRLEKAYEWMLSGSIQKLTEEYIASPNSPESSPTKQSMDGLARIDAGKVVFLFDGHITRSHFVQTAEGFIHAGDRLSTRKVPADWLLLRLQQVSLSVFLREEGTTIAYLGKAPTEGKDCHILEFSKSSGKIKGTFHLAVEQGLALVKCELEIKNTQLPFNTKAIYYFDNLQDYNGLWLPREVILTIYRVYPDRQELSAKEIMTVKDLQVNVPIPAENLSLEFPKGTSVHDAILGMDYKVE